MASKKPRWKRPGLWTAQQFQNELVRRLGLAKEFKTAEQRRTLFYYWQRLGLIPEAARRCPYSRPDKEGRYRAGGLQKMWTDEQVEETFSLISVNKLR